MRFTPLKETRTTKYDTDSFYGYNHQIKIVDGEFYEMENMTSDHFPVLSPRKKRGSFVFPTEGTHHVTGMIGKDALCYVDSGTLYVDNMPINDLILTDGTKQLVSMGAYIVIFPDKKYINTKDLTEHGSLDAAYTSPEGTEDVASVTYSMCKVDGSELDDVIVSASAPSDPKGGQYWVDTSGTTHSLKIFDEGTGMWTGVATCYVKIAAPNIGLGFKQYDAVTITGIDPEITQLKDLEGKTSVLYDVKDNYLVVIGFLDHLSDQGDPITVKRQSPEMDFVIESQNRLWGCRYGLSHEGKVVNEIYASKLGDFRNWFCYMGISTDSYAASCGTDGPFTGAINHLGYPLFFKETCLHKVYGSYPAQYQIQSTELRGVMKGAGRSLATVNEALFYKSRTGICVYDGSLPKDIGSVFGDITYAGVDEDISDGLRNGAVGGSHGGKYYISMKSDVDGMWHLFVYDVAKGMWHREDTTSVDQFLSHKGELYFIDHLSGGIKTVLGSGIPDEAPVDWMAETGFLGTVVSSNRLIMTKASIKHVMMRLAMTIGARLSVFIQYDSSGEWEHVATVTGTTLQPFNFPVQPRRCDHFRLKLVGTGDIKVFSLTKTVERGSDER